jgi:hypothetical protein
MKALLVDRENVFQVASEHHSGDLPADATERDAWIISTREVDGNSVIVSRYSDDTWWFTGSTTNTVMAKTRVIFSVLPVAFRSVGRELLYRYLTKGRSGGKRAGAATLVRFFNELKLFLEYLDQLGISQLSHVTTFTCATYAQKQRQADPAESDARRLSPPALYRRLSCVETAYILSQHTSTPIPDYPWPGTTPGLLGGVTGTSKSRPQATPLMSDEAFASLFNHAWSILEQADFLLQLRDDLERAKPLWQTNGMHKQINVHLAAGGWVGGAAAFNKAVQKIRTACYVIIASVSGCRNHELAFLQTGAAFTSTGEDDETYWWMRSKSTKTDEGVTEWMVPQSAVRALRIMETWAAPYQASLANEIEQRRAADPRDPHIAIASEHVGALFVGIDPRKHMQVRTLSLLKLNLDLKSFASDCDCDLDHELSSHQFRRKFASYAARSQFGDLRYLREHFKHWSMDMTLGYALNESQEMELYLEIQAELDEIRESVAATWLSSSEPLAGGYGANIVNWRERGMPITLFKDHKHMIRSIAQSTSIRSNGHAWCTADDNQCVGNDLEPTRCGSGCGNAVIGLRHAPIYLGLYNQLKELEDCPDIGEGGRARVRRDLARCRQVLIGLGTPVGVAA